MMSVLYTSEKNDLLQQVALADAEIKEILKGAPAEGKHHQEPASKSKELPRPESQKVILLTSQEMDSIIEAKSACCERLNASCCACKSTMP